MKVYIAAPWDERDRAREEAKKVEARGYTITHNWWDYDVPDQNEDGLIECAENDIDAVWQADVFILLNTQERGKETSGKAVETGIALALRRLRKMYGEKPLALYGVGIRGTNVFQLTYDWIWLNSVDAVLDAVGVRLVATE